MAIVLSYGIDRITEFPGSSRISDLVRLEVSDGDLRVAVDDDGAGSDFTAVADLAGVSGVTLNQLVTDGNLALA